MTFQELGLLDEVKQAVVEKGYETPTPIQAQAIPAILGGRDIIGSAQTGTGKTAAFTLPLLTKLAAHKEGGPRALILTPTRELAIQVHDQLKLYGGRLDLRTALLYGGVKYGQQNADIEAGPDIVVATPGRLIDHIENGKLRLGNIEILVLDEVDRMLDLGFIDAVRKIANWCPKERQTLLFSATVPDEIQRLAKWILRDPEKVSVETQRAASTVDHAIYPIDPLQKYDLLLTMLKHYNYESVLIFTRMKIEADRVARWLEDNGHSVVVLHSDRSQSERRSALEGFKEKKVDILVATDIAARGLDIAGISHVINFNVPQNPEDYVHRIGRTGRAAREGEAYTLFSGDEIAFLEAIERYLDRKIERRKLEGFNYRNEPDLGNKPAIRKRRNRGFSRGAFSR